MFVDERVKKCVVFLGTKERGVFRPKATAFYIAITDHDVGFRYLVTAEHVVSGMLTKNMDIWVRANLKDGAAREDLLRPDGWSTHYGYPTGELTDVALASVDVAPDEDLLMIPLSPPENVAATADVLRGHRIGVGHEIFTTGLFRSHSGNQRNIPIVRVGNIAMMRDEPVRTNNCGDIDAYLVETRSVHGLSGSPVFVNTHGKLFLLGLMHGHFDVPNLTEDVVVEDADGARGIHTGIGVVIPVEKIIETLNQPELIEERRHAAADHIKRQSNK
jgi:hypothetical protein